MRMNHPIYAISSSSSRRRIFFFNIVVVALMMILLGIAVNTSFGATVREISSSSTTSVCRALALGGGGDRGAYEAGVLKYLVENLSPEQVQYQVIGGISAGAINSVALSQYKIGDEKDAVAFILYHWLTLQKSKVYKDWTLGIAEGFLIKSGLFDTSPLHNFLATNVNVTKVRQSGRSLLLGATNLATNSYERFDQFADDLIEATRASSAVPGVFEAVPLTNNGKESLYVDGGAKYMTPISDTIAECFRKTNASRVEVDVILAIGDLRFGSNDIFNKVQTTPFILLKTLFGVVDDIFTKDIENAKNAFGNRASIRVFKPSKWLPGYFLGFNDAAEMINQGYQDAANVIKK